MAQPDPWAFGWTPLFTLIGFGITTCLGIAGLRTFSRWKREAIGERKLETAIEALALAYKSKYIFEAIRSPMSFGYEWEDMPITPGETEHQRSSKGSFYAVGKRIERNKDFFERAFKLQPKCMAMFGKEAEDIFMLMHRARRAIEVSAQTLAWKSTQYERGERDHNESFYMQCRTDIWGVDAEKDKVGQQLKEFQERMEKMFQPVIGRDFKKPA